MKTLGHVYKVIWAFHVTYYKFIGNFGGTLNAIGAFAVASRPYVSDRDQQTCHSTSTEHMDFECLSSVDLVIISQVRNPLNPVDWLLWAPMSTTVGDLPKIVSIIKSRVLFSTTVYTCHHTIIRFHRVFTQKLALCRWEEISSDLFDHNRRRGLLVLACMKQMKTKDGIVSGLDISGTGHVINSLTDSAAGHCGKEDAALTNNSALHITTDCRYWW